MQRNVLYEWLTDTFETGITKLRNVNILYNESRKRRARMLSVMLWFGQECTKQELWHLPHLKRSQALGAAEPGVPV